MVGQNAVFLLRKQARFPDAIIALQSKAGYYGQSKPCWQQSQESYEMRRSAELEVHYMYIYMYMYMDTGASSFPPYRVIWVVVSRRVFVFILDLLYPSTRTGFLIVVANGKI